MKRKYRRGLIYILANIIIILLLNDALLYWLDPLGVVENLHANHDIRKIMKPHSTGYALTPGTHNIHGTTLNVLDDYSRAVPDTNPADCTVAAIGDSVTFGQGVNDGETWLNLLARDYSNVRFVNVARSDYSAANVAQLKATTAANGYIWLIIFNDAIGAYQYANFEPIAWYPPATKIYLHWLTARHETNFNEAYRTEDMTLYFQSVEQIADEDTLILGFDNDPLAIETSEQYPVNLISYWTHNVSFVDGHPNAPGHEEIYQQIQPYFENFIGNVCL